MLASRAFRGGWVLRGGGEGGGGGAGGSWRVASPVHLWIHWPPSGCRFVHPVHEASGHLDALSFGHVVQHEGCGVGF